MISCFLHFDMNIFRIGVTIVNFQEPPIVPVTFITTGSHARLRGYEGASSLNVSLSFRTYEPRGLLIWHELSTGDTIKVCIDFQVIIQKIVFVFSFSVYF